MFFVVNVNALQTSQHVPVAHEEWLTQDLQRYLPDHQVQTLQASDQPFITLLKEQTTGIPRGVTFLVPDINQSVLKQAALSNLYQSLNDHGWTSLLLTMPNYQDIQQTALIDKIGDQQTGNAESISTDSDNTTNSDTPSANSSTTDETKGEATEASTISNPNDYYNKAFQQPLALNQNELSPLKQALESRVNATVEFAGQFPGFYLMVCEGKVCPMMISLIAEQKLPRPDALIMLSAYSLGTEANRNFANQMSMTDYPILDLSQTWDNRWIEAHKPWRAKMARKNFKTDYRQRTLNSYYDYHGQQRRVIKEILGFLYSVGM